MSQIIKIQKNKSKGALTPPEIEQTTGAILIRSAWTGRIPGHSRRQINTGVFMEIPEDYVGLINTHESLTNAYPLRILEQTIDSTQREEIKLFAINYSPYPENIKHNQIIAKILLVPKTDVALKTVAKLKVIKEEK